MSGRECREWVERNPHKAAFIMGYEVVNKKSEHEIESHHKVTRKSILQKAEKCVCGDRDQQYGSPENSFSVIAAFWTHYIANKCAPAKTIIDIGPEDVAAMMVLFKMARVATGSYSTDSWVDAAGYAACGGEIGGQNEN